MEKKLKYKCLVLDHDDTVVNSTATIHYPSFRAWFEKENRKTDITLEDYFRYNFDPGVVPFFRDICGMSNEDMLDEQSFWREFTKKTIPSAYPGIKEILEEYKERGGIITVVSHSYSENIIRDYKANDLPLPDVTYGWEYPTEKKKPNPWPIYQILDKYGLAKEEVLVIDDLKPGFDMAKAAGVPFVAAGWANDIKEIEAFMRQNCDVYLGSVEELRKYLFD